MWYVIQVGPRREHEILALCEKWVRIPSEEFFVMRCMGYRRRTDGTWDKLERLAFPGYIFVRTDDIDDLRLRLKKIPELTKVLGAGDEIFPIYEEEEKLLWDLGGEDHFIKASHGYRDGDKVVVVDGSLINKEGLITWVNAHKRMALIEIQFAGRTVRTKVGLEIITKEQ